MDLFGSKSAGNKSPINLSAASVTKEQDIAKQMLELLAPVFGASLPIKLAIQASIMRTDNDKLHHTLIAVRDLLNKEV